MMNDKDNEMINKLSEEDYDWEEEEKELEEFRAGLRELGGAGFIQSNLGMTILILIFSTVFVLLFGEKLGAMTRAFINRLISSM